MNIDFRTVAVALASAAWVCSMGTDDECFK